MDLRLSAGKMTTTAATLIILLIAVVWATVEDVAAADESRGVLYASVDITGVNTVFKPALLNDMEEGMTPMGLSNVEKLKHCHPVGTVVELTGKILTLAYNKDRQYDGRRVRVVASDTYAGGRVVVSQPKIWIKDGRLNDLSKFKEKK